MSVSDSTHILHSSPSTEKLHDSELFIIGHEGGIIREVWSDGVAETHLARWEVAGGEFKMFNREGNNSGFKNAIASMAATAMLPNPSPEQAPDMYKPVLFLQSIQEQKVAFFDGRYGSVSAYWLDSTKSGYVITDRVNDAHDVPVGVTSGIIIVFGWSHGLLPHESSVGNAENVNEPVICEFYDSVTTAVDQKKQSALGRKVLDPVLDRRMWPF